MTPSAMGPLRAGVSEAAVLEAAAPDGAISAGPALASWAGAGPARSGLRGGNDIDAASAGTEPHMAEPTATRSARMCACVGFICRLLPAATRVYAKNVPNTQEPRRSKPVQCNEISHCLKDSGGKMTEILVTGSEWR